MRTFFWLCWSLALCWSASMSARKSFNRAIISSTGSPARTWEHFYLITKQERPKRKKKHTPASIIDRTVVHKSASIVLSCTSWSLSLDPTKEWPVVTAVATPKKNRAERRSFMVSKSKTIKIQKSFFLGTTANLCLK